MKGQIMSHSTRATMNKHQKHPKVNFQQYLYNSGEPDDDIKHDDDNLRLQNQADRYYMVMRRQIRRNAQRLRMRYSE